MESNQRMPKQRLPAMENGRWQMETNVETLELVLLLLETLTSVGPNAARHR
ncbi:GL10946 [Drosophila persimilis]|uniref:GL10946 n=1 Tax=Drosophila persimilis TaxID=7234 RepID=B4GCM8_DROPE|nr:GL10946 [Drosophila persimilis]